MNQNSPEGVRKPVLYAVWLLIVVAIMGVAFKWFNRKQADSQPTENADAAPAPKAGYSRPKPIHAVSASGSVEPAATAPSDGQTEPRTKPPVPASTPAATRLQPTPETRALVSALANLDVNAPLTPEAAAAWREKLAGLVQTGAAGLPAIQEFLALNKDVNFESLTGGAGLLGSTSLRMSLLDALGNHVEELRHATPNDLRVGTGDQPGRIDEVHEQDRCELSLHVSSVETQAGAGAIPTAGSAL